MEVDPDPAAAPNCHCWQCSPPDIRRSRMIVCEFCGCKRCPHATSHEFKCTGSNEPGQIGSRFGADPAAALSRLADKAQPVGEHCKETYHPKIRFGKPVVITREHERIIIERKPRDGREAVVVTIEQIEETA